MPTMSQIDNRSRTSPGIAVKFEPKFISYQEPDKVGTQWAPALLLSFRMMGVGPENIRSLISNYIGQWRTSVRPFDESEESFLRTQGIPPSIATTFDEFDAFMGNGAYVIRECTITNVATTVVPNAENRGYAGLNLPTVTRRWGKRYPLKQSENGNYRDLVLTLHGVDGKPMIEYRLHTEMGTWIAVPVGDLYINSAGPQSAAPFSLRDFFTDVEFTVADARIIKS